MKFRGRGRRRRFRKKRRQNPLGKNIPNHLRKYRCNIEVAIGVNIVSAGAGIVQKGFTIAMNFPCCGRDDGGTVRYPLTATGIFGTVFTSGVYGATMAFFDEYKVMSLKCRFEPSYTQTLASSAEFPTGDETSYMYHINDNDDDALLTSESRALEEGVHPWNIAKNQNPLYHTFRQLKNYSRFWINTGNAAVAPGTATVGANTLPPQSYASVKFLTQITAGAAQSNFIGKLFLTWDCMFRANRNNI